MDGSAIVNLKNSLNRLRQERDEITNDVMEEKNIISGMD